VRFFSGIQTKDRGYPSDTYIYMYKLEGSVELPVQTHPFQTFGFKFLCDDSSLDLVWIVFISHFLGILVVTGIEIGPVLSCVTIFMNYRVHDLNYGVVVLDEYAAFVIPRYVPSSILFAPIVIEFKVWFFRCGIPDVLVAPVQNISTEGFFIVFQ